DVEHVLDRERLEEQHLTRVVIGAHGLRIRIDHYRFDAELLERETRVATAIVKLNPLPDPVWPAAENDDPLLSWLLRRYFVFIFVCGIVVRRVSFELGRAGIDRFERRTNSQLQSRLAYDHFSGTGDPRKLLIGKPLSF